MPGQNGFDPQKPDFEGSASLSEARFFYQWDLRTDPESGGIYTMNGGTYRWGRAAWKATQDLLGDDSPRRGELYQRGRGEDHDPCPGLSGRAGLLRGQ